MVIGITPSLPFKCVHLLLGNDLAGDKVVVNPLVTDTPNIGQTDNPIEQEIPDLYPSCAVTRAMAKKAILKNSNSDIDLTDTFIGQYFNNEIKKSLEPSLSDTQTDSSMSCHSPPRSIDQGHDTLSKSQLIQEQQTDPEISKLIFRALPEYEISQVPMCYYIKNGILIDCVGPLPRTKSGNEYLLTIMCTSTRFPEAIPLRNIKTKSIFKALIKFFTFVGLPKSVQSDQGSNFMSGIFQQVMHELGIKQYRSSAYHPESQGAL